MFGAKERLSQVLNTASFIVFSSSYRNSGSIVSSMSPSTTTAPVTKTSVSLEWSKKKAKELENKRWQEKEKQLSSDISLWTVDSEARAPPLSRSTIKETYAAKVSDSSVKPKVNKATTSKNKTPAESDDDEDLIITSENIRRTVRPLKNLPDGPWMILDRFTRTGSAEWLEERRTHKTREAVTRRKIEENELILRKCQERRIPEQSVIEAVNRDFKLLDMRHPAPRYGCVVFVRAVLFYFH